MIPRFVRSKDILLIGNFHRPSEKYRNICDDLAEHLQGIGWIVSTTSMHRNPALRILDIFWKIISKPSSYSIAQIDVYSGKAFYWAEFSAFLLKQLGKPFVLTLHGGNLPEFAAQTPKRVKALFSKAAAITAPSSYLIDKMKNYGKNIQLLPNGVQVSQFKYKDRQAISPKLVWARAFHKIYNPILVPRVLEKLNKIQELSLKFIGPDHGDGSLARSRILAGNLKIDSQIEWCGGLSRSELALRFDESDIFINTSNYDNVPLSLLEAMSAGLCIVTTSVGGIPYLLSHEENSLLVSANDADAMADAVKRILLDRSLAAKLSRNARLKAEEFRWETIVSEWDNLLSGILFNRIP